jgi:regulator of protease activity HflC (stomatin/prohibitin superfamily)
MQFTIEKERLEADRKRIEAQGIADFQKIVSAGLTSSYLKWKGIEATEHMATSTNTKIVMVGNSSNSMPVILSADK